MASSVKDMLAAANCAVPRIQPADLRDRISKGDVVVVDVRDAPELATGGKIKGAVHVPRGMLEFRADPESPYHNPLLGRRRPSSSIAHQAGARHSLEKRCKSLATSRSTMRAPSRIWRKRVWRQSQLNDAVRRGSPVDPVPVADQVAWGLIPGKGLGNLLRIHSAVGCLGR